MHDFGPIFDHFQDHALSTRATRRHDASSGERARSQGQTSEYLRRRPRASAMDASFERPTRDRPGITHRVQPVSTRNSVERRFPLSNVTNLPFRLSIEPPLLPSNRNGRSSLFPSRSLDRFFFLSRTCMYLSGDVHRHFSVSRLIALIDFLSPDSST